MCGIFLKYFCCSCVPLVFFSSDVYEKHFDFHLVIRFLINWQLFTKCGAIPAWKVSFMERRE
jgi:hypothetical protein